MIKNQWREQRQYFNVETSSAWQPFLNVVSSTLFQRIKFQRCKFDVVSTLEYRCSITGVRISITAKKMNYTIPRLKYWKSLSLLSICYAKNDRNGNLGNPARVTLNSPSICPYSVKIMSRCVTAFYPLARFGQ